MREHDVRERGLRKSGSSEEKRATVRNEGGGSPERGRFVLRFCPSAEFEIY